MNRRAQFQPMYRQLADLLRESIQAGEYADGRFPPERTLAEQFGVSATLVRSALDILVREGLLVRQQGRGTFVAAKLRRQADAAKPAIYLAMSEERWQTALGGPSLYVRMLRQMLDHAEDAGYELVLHTRFDQQSRRLQSIATSQLLAGALVFHHGHARRLRKTLRPGTPIVCLDHCVHLCNDTHRAPEVTYVACDNRQAGRDLTHYMLRKGHRRFALIGGDAPKFPTHAERIEGMQQALVEAGIDPNELHVVLEGDIGPDLPHRLHDRNITAVVAYNDCSALSFLTMLQAAGLHVPEEISLATFDDLFPVLDQTTPSITAMTMPVDAMAQTAWNCLTAPASREAVIRLPYSLAKRESVARASRR